MRLTKPRRLEPGDRLAAVSLSWGGPGAFPYRYEAGKAQLEAEVGVELVATPHALADPDWLARHPEARARDLMEAFADPSIRGIISTIGGEDSIRLLPHLDLGVIRDNPKVFLGYSDTTVTHLACYMAGLATFYGPSILAGFAENQGLPPYLVDSVRRTLFSAEPIGELRANTNGWTVEYLEWAEPENQLRERALKPCEPWKFLQGSGVVEGHLLGGCLDVLEFLRGTSIWPEPAAWEGAILFLETSEEGPPPAAVTRALRSYAAMGLLDKLAGLLFGRPGGGVPTDTFKDYDEAILQAVTVEEGLTDLPVVTGMDFGHTDPMLVLPYGITTRIDCDRRRIEIPEPAVTGPESA